MTVRYVNVFVKGHGKKKTRDVSWCILLGIFNLEIHETCFIRQHLISGSESSGVVEYVSSSWPLISRIRMEWLSTISREIERESVLQKLIVFIERRSARVQPFGTAKSLQTHRITRWIHKHGARRNKKKLVKNQKNWSAFVRFWNNLSEFVSNLSELVAIDHWLNAI